MNNFDREKRDIVFPLVGMSVTWGHNFKMVSKRARSEVRRNLFTQRVVGI